MCRARNTRDLQASCQVCEQLDIEAGLPRTVFWCSQYVENIPQSQISFVRDNKTYTAKTRIFDPRKGVWLQLAEVQDNPDGDSTKLLDVSDKSSSVEVSGEITDARSSKADSRIEEDASQLRSESRTENTKRSITDPGPGDTSCQNVVQVSSMLASKESSEQAEKDIVVCLDGQLVTARDVLGFGEMDDELLNAAFQWKSLHDVRAQWLDDVTVYLRSRHLYCNWCGRSFGNDAELKTQCPGPTAEDHAD